MDSDFTYYQATVPKKAITLVVHGLNVRPDAMFPIIEWLKQHGSDTCLVKLAGHHENSIPLQQVSFAAWESSMRKGYDYAKNIAIENKLPLVFLGYSLGALLGQLLLSSPEKPIAFDKQILLAPAIALRKRVNLLRFFFLFNDLRLPSFTPEAYRANKGLPVKWYKVVFKMNSNMRKGRCHKLNIPTLVFIDPKDELISYSRLAELCRRYQLTRYELVALDSDVRTGERPYHHLIINELAMGSRNWQLMTSKMRDFIFEH